MRTLSLLVLIALGGCAGATRTIEPSAELAVVAGAVAGRTATLVLRDGSEHRGRSLAVAPDTVSWVDVDTGALLLTPTAAVAEVRLYNRGRSTARTAGAGSLVGAGVGTVYGLAICNGNCLGLDRLFSAVFAVGGAMTGALVGAIGGADANRPDRYILGPRAPYQGDLVIPARPTPGPPPPPAGQ